MQKKWRIIKPQAFDAYMNMALDEVICDGIKRGESAPTIRLYSWSPSAVSIGYFQGLDIELNLKECRKQNIDYIRRRTGGGAVYHDSEGEITYSLLCPEDLYPKGITESYAVICEYVVSALITLGLDATFAPINDILVDGKKISGNAQTRRGGVLQQHGTILYDVDVDKMFSYLNVSKEKIADKLIASVKKRVCCVKDFEGISKEQVVDALLAAFTAGKEWEYGDYTEKELTLAKKLAIDKYKNAEWNNMR
jgi:lipoyltransferase/lipoate-protein ligase